MSWKPFRDPDRNRVCLFFYLEEVHSGLELGNISELNHEIALKTVIRSKQVGLWSCFSVFICLLFPVQGHRRTRGFLSMSWVKQLSVTQWGKHIHTSGNLEYSIHPFYMSLDCVRKPEHSEETGADKVRTCKHHTGRIQLTGSVVCAGLTDSAGREVPYHTKLADEIVSGLFVKLHFITFKVWQGRQEVNT